MEALEVVGKHRNTLLRLPGVLAVGVGQSVREPERFCILVYAASWDPPAGMPERLEGYPVEFQSTRCLKTLSRAVAPSTHVRRAGRFATRIC